MTTLIIVLPPEPPDASVSWDYALSPDGNAVAEQSRAPMALLPGGADEVVALVPVRQISWHRVTLPRGVLDRRFFQDGGTARLRAVLEGLLEDRLLDETEHLHFAIEPKPASEGPVWVAVCNRVWLQNGLQALERSGRAVARIVPEFAPAASSQTLHVLGDPDQADLVVSAPAGVAVWPACAASLALIERSDGIALVAEPAVAALAEQLFGQSVTIEQGGQRWLQAAHSPWDLAQFEFVNSNRARAWKHGADLMNQFARAPRWRAARWAVLCLIAVNLVGLNAWAWKEQSGLQARRSAIASVLTTTFPSVRLVIDAPVQMAREVALLQKANGVASGRDLEAMLSALSAVAPVESELTTIEFVAGELRLKGLTLGPDALAATVFKLAPLGYRLTEEGGSLVLRQEARS